MNRYELEAAISQTLITATRVKGDPGGLDESEITKLLSTYTWEWKDGDRLLDCDGCEITYWEGAGASNSWLLGAVPFDLFNGIRYRRPEEPDDLDFSMYGDPVRARIKKKLAKLYPQK
jgi:hypothetical protein